MKYVHLLTESHDSVFQITINRPDKRNALSVPVLQELANAINFAKSETSVRCLLLSGAGRSFSAGADLEEWASADAEGELETYGWTEAAHSLILQLHGLRKPTVAAIDGPAVGAGLDLALACDFRLSSNAGIFKAGHILMAYSPDSGGSAFLPALIGIEKAKRFIYFAEKWDALKAQEEGLVTEFYDENFQLNVQSFAKKLANGPTLAIGNSKMLINESLKHTLAEQLELEKSAAKECGRSYDANEALEAVVEKRKPSFKGI